MDSTGSTPDISGKIVTYLPHLRRFARALTGSQSAGDSYAAATLEVILEDMDSLSPDLDPKTALFRVFNRVWATSGARIEDEGGDTGRALAAGQRLAMLTPQAREAFLLSTLEDFDNRAVAAIMGMSETDASALVEIGEAEMASDMNGRVLIIEDETIVAIELRSVVEDLGHEVLGIARTEDAALALGRDQKPELVLADIHLADDSSGIDAVNTLLSIHGETPVIFITAYPERLLTGERPEPTFLIAKPFKVSQVRAAVEQALFFRSSALISA